jgi:hypothetical protein
MRTSANSDSLVTGLCSGLPLQEILHHEHHIEVPVKCLEGRLYVRLSAHVHNSLDQYERLAQVVKGMMY